MMAFSRAGFAILLAVGALVMGCRRAPYTNRIQYNLIPNGIVRTLGTVTYSEMLKGAKVQKGGANVTILKRVGKRISTAASQPKFDWRYRLIREKTINAWCLPGGKIAFYTGILPALKNEAGMAFVMGHEVGHATANHGAERMSQQLTVLGGLGGLSLYLQGKSKMNPKQRKIVMGALGLGVEVGVLLPFSRAHEAEADIIGLMYMAKAGYPPGESIRVWDRMGKASPTMLPAFLSTHPANKKRQATLKQWMPRAKKRYLRNKVNRNTLKRIW